jgi:hypothetical protein
MKGLFCALLLVVTPSLKIFAAAEDETLWAIQANNHNWYDKRPDTFGTGFFGEVFTLVGQWDRHVDPPVHFIKGSQQGVNLRSIGILPPAMVENLLG